MEQNKIEKTDRQMKHKRQNRELNGQREKQNRTERNIEQKR